MNDYRLSFDEACRLALQIYGHSVAPYSVEGSITDNEPMNTHTFFNERRKP